MYNTSDLTLEEKVSLCSGQDYWHLKGIDRLHIPALMVANGPHGLRKKNTLSNGRYDKSIPSICFPCSSAMASSWDRTLIHSVGVAIGEACLEENISILLGPGMNIKRSPLCGRNFEYYSEDPYLTGELGSAFINGVQSKGVAASMKHYALNNQETRRTSINVIVDERAMHEIYLRGFQIAVEKGNPWTIMSSYNQVNGTYASESHELLHTILREEWGYSGVVISDWGACNDRLKGLKAGLDIEMPYSGIYNSQQLIKAYHDNDLSENELHTSVQRILHLIQKTQPINHDAFSYDRNDHLSLAKEAALKSAVLLKNTDILPLSTQTSIGVIGDFARKPRYQGSGSSAVNPTSVENICSILDSRDIPYQFGNTKKDVSTIAKTCDVLILVVGLPESYETEALDREHLDLPPQHTCLIEAAAQTDCPIVVLLQNGAPIIMPWIDQVGAILECYLSGQSGASAIVDLLYGIQSPSGKLAETFPLQLEDTPCYNHFPGYTKTVEYRESIYVGYRYYDSFDLPVLFPFGHGLSYTTFEYKHLRFNSPHGLPTSITFTLTNTGQYAGEEIAQVYIHAHKMPISRPTHELKGFKKVYLKPGESCEVTIPLDPYAFSYYDTYDHHWRISEGFYSIQVGASSRDLRLFQTLHIHKDIADPMTRPAIRHPFSLDESAFTRLYGRPLPPRERHPYDLYTLNDTIGEANNRLLQKLVFQNLEAYARESLLSDGEGDEHFTDTMVHQIVEQMTFRSIRLLGGDSMHHVVEGMLMMLNGKRLRGLIKLLRG